jgi:hypothetical protein
MSKRRPHPRPFATRWGGVAAVLVALVMPGGPASAATPTPGGNGSTDYPTSVACTGPDSCWATRTTVQNAAEDSLQRWDGRRWQVVALPAATGTTLSSITCPSSNQCWAAGSADPTQEPDGQRNRLLHWDGTSWKDVSVPAQPTEPHRSTACPAAARPTAGR